MCFTDDGQRMRRSHSGIGNDNITILVNDPLPKVKCGNSHVECVSCDNIFSCHLQVRSEKCADKYTEEEFLQKRSGPLLHCGHVTYHSPLKPVSQFQTFAQSFIEHGGGGCVNKFNIAWMCP